MAENAVPRERLFALRETIARIENENLPGLVRSARSPDKAGFRQAQAGAATAGRKVLPLGIAEIDRVLEGGLALEGLTEIRARQTRDTGAATGFVLSLAVLCQDRAPAGGPALPVLWVGQAMGAAEAGLPYPVGLKAHGLDVGRFVMGTPRTVADALWIVEAALAAPVFAAVIVEVRGNPACLGLSESRRLHVRARACGTPLLLLRQSGEEEASSALFRLRIEPAPARARPLPDGSVLSGSIGNPVFHVTAEKSRVLSPVGISMEWNPHDRRFYPVERRTAAVAAEPSATHPVGGVSASARRSSGAAAVGHVVAFKRAS